MDLMQLNAPCVKLLLANNSDQVAIPLGCNFITIYNPSEDTVVYCKTVETSSSTCDATATPIPPKSKESFRRDPTHGWLAGYTTDTVTIEIQNGGGA